MRLVIFEAGGSENLYPLTYLRATCELRCGHTTLGKKIQRSAGTVSETAYVVRSLLEPTFKQRYPGIRVNEPDILRGDDLLLVDGRVLAPDKLILPDDECIIMDDNRVVIAKITQVTAESITTGKIGDFLAGIASRLPKLNTTVTVIRYPWELVNHNTVAIKADFRSAACSGIEGSMHELSCIYGPMDQCYVAPGADIHPMVVLDTTHGPITISENAVISPHTRIEGPAYVGPGTRIMGGKIREGCSFGPECRVGGEVEETIIHGYSNKYHDGFIGHSYIGEWVNLGALTSNSDLKNDYTNVEVKIGRKTHDSGSMKVGSFIGDHTKTSIGTLLNTGSYIGVMCLLMASGAPMPKFIPSFSWFLNGRFLRGTGLKNLIKTAHASMERRKHSLSADEIALLEAVYTMTREFRDPLVKRDSKALLRR